MAWDFDGRDHESIHDMLAVVVQSVRGDWFGVVTTWNRDDGLAKPVVEC